jgi:hypothetical protein
MKMLQTNLCPTQVPESSSTPAGEAAMQANEIKSKRGFWYVLVQFCLCWQERRFASSPHSEMRLHWGGMFCRRWRIDAEGGQGVKECETAVGPADGKTLSALMMSVWRLR